MRKTLMEMLIEAGYPKEEMYHPSYGSDLYVYVTPLTTKGIEYLENWEENWDDKRSERYVHDQIMKKYSILPHFAHKVYGCPKVQWKKDVA